MVKKKRECFETVGVRMGGVNWEGLRRRVLLGVVLFGVILGIVSFFHRKAPQRETPYIIAMPTRWENIQMFGNDNSVTGFSRDLLVEVARLTEIKVDFISAEANDPLTILKEKKADAIVTSLVPGPATERLYEFSVPYFTVGTVIVVPEHSRFHTSSEIEDAVIAFDRGDTGDISLGAKSSWLLKPYPSSISAIEDVIAGKVDGMILPSFNASRLNKSFYRSKIRILWPPLTRQGLYLIALQGKNKELIDLFNTGLESYKKSGEYQKLLDYWEIDSFLPVNE
jgi:ABC-type amino acid transport substrate-binding protein